MFRLPLASGVWSVEWLVLCAWLRRKGVEGKFWPSSVIGVTENLLPPHACTHTQGRTHRLAHGCTHRLTRRLTHGHTHRNREARGRAELAFSYNRSCLLNSS